MKFILLSLLFVSTLHAQSNIFKDPSCKMAIKQKQERQYPELINALKNTLAEKDFGTYQLKKDQRVPIGSLHVTLKKTMVGNGLYPSCQIEVKIQRAEHTHLNKSDKNIFKLSARRSFPRLTFKGIARCKRAIRDALYSLPYCKGPQ